MCVRVCVYVAIALLSITRYCRYRNDYYPVVINKLEIGFSEQNIQPLILCVCTYIDEVLNK